VRDRSSFRKRASSAAIIAFDARERAPQNRLILPKMDNGRENGVIAVLPGSVSSQFDRGYTHGMSASFYIDRHSYVNELGIRPNPSAIDSRFGQFGAALRPPLTFVPGFQDSSADIEAALFRPGSRNVPSGTVPRSVYYPDRPKHQPVTRTGRPSDRTPSDAEPALPRIRSRSWNSPGGEQTFSTSGVYGARLRGALDYAFVICSGAPAN